MVPFTRAFEQHILMFRGTTKTGGATQFYLWESFEVCDQFEVRDMRGLPEFRTTRDATLEENRLFLWRSLIPQGSHVWILPLVAFLSCWFWGKVCLVFLATFSAAPYVFAVGGLDLCSLQEIVELWR